MMKYFIAFLLIVLCITIVASQEFSNDTFYSNQVILNIYINESGRALITGYVENLTLANLQFLNSEYLYIIRKNREKSLEKSIDWNHRATKIPEIPFKDKKEIDTNKIEVTSEMKKVMETLSARERAIVDLLIKENGSLLQSKIRYETEIPKASLTGIIYSLERKKIIKKKKYGKTNKIELSEWFLSKNKDD